MKESDSKAFVQLYQFEPLPSDVKPAFVNYYAAEKRVSSDDRHLTNLSWCWCENCITMPTARECQCCWEVESAVDILDGAKCITLVESFRDVCLNKHVLEMGIATNRHHRGKSPGFKSGVPNKVYRHQAYKNYIFWIFRHKTTKNIRIEIPACVVKDIRKAFLNTNNEPYIGFLDVLFQD